MHANSRQSPHIEHMWVIKKPTNGSAQWGQAVITKVTHANASCAAGTGWSQSTGMIRAAVV